MPNPCAPPQHPTVSHLQSEHATKANFRLDPLDGAYSKTRMLFKVIQTHQAKVILTVAAECNIVQDL